MNSFGRIARTLFVAWACCLVTGSPAQAGPARNRPGVAPVPAASAETSKDGSAYVPGKVLVGLRADAVSRPDAVVSNIQAVLPGTIRKHLKHTPRQDVMLVDLPQGQTVEQALREGWRGRDARIEYVEPDYLMYLQDLPVPNDPLFGQQWSLHEVPALAQPTADIAALEGWQIQRYASAGVIVGLTDSGIDYTHPDLKDNIWVNPGEVPGNGVDDDGNGYVDDVHGWDWFGSGFGDAGGSDVLDLLGHGTHCAGIIGAVADNGIGISGVAWSVKIMALRIGGVDGTISVSAAVPAIEYAISKGAKVISASWGGTISTQALYDAIADARDAGALFVCAAGNTLPAGTDRDTLPLYPACFDLDNIISVASTDYNGQLSWFSDYGLNAIDVAAPGSGTYLGDPVQILSTWPAFTPLIQETFELVDVPVGGTAEIGSLLTKGGTNNLWGTVLDDTNKVACADWMHTTYAVGGSDGWLQTPERDTTACAGLTLKFSYRIGNGPDHFSLAVADGSGGWTPLAHNFQSNGKWYSASIDLRHYSSEHLSIRFFWNTSSFVGSQAPCIDDVTLQYVGSDHSNAYRQLSGTSMATPHVAGAVALLLSHYPDMTYQQVKQRLMKTVDPLPTLAGKCVSGGRINLYAALAPVRNLTRGTWYPTIQAALDDARAGDEIVVGTGTFRENVVISTPVILRSITPDDPATVDATVIQDDGRQGDCVVAAAGSVLSGLTVRSGYGVVCGENVTVQKCVITGSAGSGLRQGGGQITDCTIRGNGDGGIVSFAGTIRRCTITGNHGAASGAGLRACAGTIEDCLIAGNDSDDGGGAMARVAGTVRNCLLVGNTSHAAGGAVLASASAPLGVTNCTIVGNAADGNGGGAAGADATLTNCIVWDNAAGAGGDQIAALGGTVNVCYCDVQGGQAGTWAGPAGAAVAWGAANIDADPLFADASGADKDPATWSDNDYRLFASSPCINAGDPSGVYAGQADMDGRGRVRDEGAGGIVDMGAYEYWRSVIHVGPGQNIADAIAQAIDGDEIVVEDGTYSGAGNVNLDLQDKNLFLHSANGPAVCVLDCQQQGRGFTIHGGQDQRTVIDGFTILNGRAPPVPGAKTKGGGISCVLASPTIRNCVIRSCSANWGGGIYCNSGSPTITQCVISGNSAYYGGGGVGVDGVSSPLLTRCRIVSNVGTYQTFGAGLYLQSTGSIRLDSCVIARNNTKYGTAGGVYCYTGTVAFTNCTIVNNTSAQVNWASGGITLSSADMTISNCILRGNMVSDMYGVQTPKQIGASGTFGSLRLHVRYCNVQGGRPTLDGLGPDDLFEYGPGNIDADPLFVDPAGADADPNNDFCLRGASPCIDAGDPAGDYGDLYALLGQPRKVGIAADIGADEYAPSLLSSDPPAGGTLCRTVNNEIRLVFSDSVALPVGANPVTIRPRLSLNPLSLGSDLAAGCLFEQQTTNLPNDTLVIHESGQLFANQTWYRIAPAAALTVSDFALDLCTSRGDISGDGGVDVVDLLWFVDSWGSNLGDPAYNPRCDFNADGTVDIVDLLTLVEFWPQ